MSKLTHTSSSLKFDIKKGDVKFTQTEKYKTEADDKSQDQFFGECPLDSDRLKKWAHAVVDDWIDATSVRPDATAAGD